jgi:hypothetical protein
MRIKIIWVNRNNPNHSGEGKFTERVNEQEVEAYCKELNKKHPELDHSYIVEK